MLGDGYAALGVEPVDITAGMATAPTFNVTFLYGLADEPHCR